MTPKMLNGMLLPNPALDSLAKKSKSAKRAVAKCNRKLRQAIRAKKLTSIRLLLGMAQVALTKAEFLANTKENRR